MAGRAGALPPARVRAAPRRRARRRRPRRRPGGRLGHGDRRGRAARDPCPLSACDRRPPDRQRRLDGGGGRRRGDPRRRADRRAPARPRPTALLARRRRPADGWRRLAPRSPAPTRPSGSPPRCLPRLAGVGAVSRAWKGSRLHFIAIGGAGMSGLALVCARLGRRGQRLGPLGVLVRRAAAGGGAGARDRPRRCPGPRGRRGRGLDRDRRGQPRAGAWPASAGSGCSTAASCSPSSARARRLIAVAGTHGKTTTTAMLVHALRETGADPTFFLGGELPGAGPDGEAANAALGEGEWAVAEADESDAQLPGAAPRGRGDHQPRARPPLALGLARRAARGVRALRRAGAAGTSSAAEVGLPGAAADRGAAVRAGGAYRGATAAGPPEPTWSPRDPADQPGGGTRFRAHGPAIDMEVELAVPGRHNVANAPCGARGALPRRRGPGGGAAARWRASAASPGGWS